MSHMQAAQEDVHVQKSTHCFSERVLSSHIEEKEQDKPHPDPRLRKLSGLLLEEITTQGKIKRTFKSIGDNGAQAEDLITVQVTC